MGNKKEEGRKVKKAWVKAWAIFHQTVCEGKIPAWFDDETGMPLTYPTERDAQLEIVDDIKERIRQFEEGEREFDDIIWDDWIEEVDVSANGSITDKDGNIYRKRE